MDINLLTIEGEVRARVETRDDPAEGTETCSFSVLTLTYGKKVYHRVRAWGELAAICRERLGLGTRVRIIGPQVYTGKPQKPECRMTHLEILTEQ